MVVVTSSSISMMETIVVGRGFVTVFGVSETVWVTLSVTGSSVLTTV